MIQNIQKSSQYNARHKQALLWLSCNLCHCYEPFEAPSGLQRGVTPKAQGRTLRFYTWDLGHTHLILLSVFLCPSLKTMVPLTHLTDRPGSLEPTRHTSPRSTTAFVADYIPRSPSAGESHSSRSPNFAGCDPHSWLRSIWLTYYFLFVCFVLNCFLFGSFCYSWCFDCEPSL